MTLQPTSEVATRQSLRSRLRRPPTPGAVVTSTAQDGRKYRRLFGRSLASAPPLALTTATPPLTPHLEEEPIREPGARRSFLAKPPVPGAARRVLTVLNQPQRSQKHSTPPSTPLPSPQIDLPSLPAHPPSPPEQPTEPVQSLPPPVIPPCTKSPIHASGYDDDPSLLDSHHLDDLRSDSEDETPTTSGNQPCSSSFDRRVSHLHEDVPEPINRFDSATSMPSSHGTSRTIDVDASEVSDELQSATDPKSRNTDLAASSSSGQPLSDSQPLFPTNSPTSVDLEHDLATSVSFDPVADDELQVPEAPNSLVKIQPVKMWSSLHHKVRILQTEIATLHQQKAILTRRNESLEQRNKDLEVLTESMRLRASESSLEAEQLTRQIRDTRRRLTRRIRELEDNASQITAKHSEQLSHQQQVENELRAENELLRSSIDRHARIDNDTNCMVRRQRSEGNSGSVNNLPKPLVDVPTRSSLSSTLDSRKRSHESPPTSASTRSRVTTLNTEAMRRRARALDSVVCSSSRLMQPSRPHSTRPGTPVRNFSVNLSHVSSSNTRKAHSSSGSASVKVTLIPSSSGGKGTSAGGNTTSLSETQDTQSTVPVRVMARRSLIRRAFIAHIQSTKYRSARNVWSEFFGAEDNVISTEQFARAVRSLAVAADARDRDLETLRDELKSLDRGEQDSISWSAFFLFYQKSKTEMI